MTAPSRSSRIFLRAHAVVPLLLAALSAALLVLAGPIGQPVAVAQESGPAGGRTGGPAGTGRSTLVLYDTTGEWAHTAELYATQAANLAGHFGSYTALPVGEYTAGTMDGFTAVVYVGSTYDEPLPEAFLADVRSAERPVVWLGHNIWRLAASSPTFAADYGWMPYRYDEGEIGTVVYKGRTLTRDASNPSGVMAYSVLDEGRAEVPATAVRADGTRLPWAVRSRNLTYVGEMPFAYTTATDRYLAFCDLLFDALAPETAERHRALVRLEDIGPAADPGDLMAIATELKKRGIPYSFGVYPVHKEPENGVEIRLRDRPEVVAAIEYMLAGGGTMIMHGYTHQYTDAPNPYNGASGDDFEFYATHVDDDDYVVYDGPVAGDSFAWAQGRLDAAAREFRAAGLPVPTIFEFPHYAGSAEDYRAVRSRFAVRYERGMYFAGTLSGTAVRYEHAAGQFFPYTVTDVYGSKVVPENIGNLIPKGYNNHPSVLPGDLAEAAEANLVVRDGVASFFYHPYLGTGRLIEIIDGIEKLGYTFVPASAM
ncbi:polysaccharide deacetylase family protein [Planomonospora alba]